jgi:hypothetical protein
MGTADNRARADTGRLRSALAVPAVERNRAKCRSQLLQAVGGYRCDIYGNHVSLRLHPLFPITNARPVCAVRRATTSQAKVNSMNALLLSPHIPSTGRGSLTTSAAISLRSRWSRPRRRLSLKSWRIFRTPRRDSDSPFCRGLFHLLRRTAAVALRIAEIPASASLARDDRAILRCLYSPAGSPPSDPQATPTAGQTLGTLCCALHVFRKAPSNRHPTHVFRVFQE